LASGGRGETGLRSDHVPVHDNTRRKSRGLSAPVFIAAPFSRRRDQLLTE